MVANVTGWNELVNGSIFLASTVLYQSYYGDWYITMLFLAFKVLLFLTTRSPMLSFISTIIFSGVFFDEIAPVLQATVVSIAVIEMAMVGYSIYIK